MDKKLVMCGCHVGGAPVIRSLLEQGVSISHFVCLTPEQGEKHRVSGFYDYTPLAQEFDIPIYHPEAYTFKSERDQAFFKENHFDILVQGGWQRLFPESVINSLSIGAIGLHGSSDFLPKGRGRSPMNWSLIEGKERFIMHLFLIKPGIDDGDVFDTEMFDITPYDDIETLYFKYSIVYRKMLERSLPKLMRGEVNVVPQLGEPSHYPKRTPDDGRIDFENQDVHAIYNFVRAQTRPYPGAYTDLDGQKVHIWRARVFDTRLTYPEKGYGEVVERFGSRFVINCRGGLLLVDEWSPAQKLT